MLPVPTKQMIVPCSLSWRSCFLLCIATVQRHTDIGHYFSDSYSHFKPRWMPVHFCPTVSSWIPISKNWAVTLLTQKEERNPTLLTALFRNRLWILLSNQITTITSVSLASVSKQGVQGKLRRLSPLALALCLCFPRESLWEGGILSALDRSCTK